MRLDRSWHRETGPRRTSWLHLESGILDDGIGQQTVAHLLDFLLRLRFLALHVDLDILPDPNAFHIAIPQRFKSVLYHTSLRVQKCWFEGDVDFDLRHNRT